jgi:hypothetical protein
MRGNPSATLVMVRLMQDPDPTAKNLLRKISLAVDAFVCPDCGFDGEPGVALLESPNKIIVYCPLCSDDNSKPDELEFKA